MTNKTYRTYKTNTINKTNRLIPPHGGYRKLAAYQMATIVYDLTTIFCKTFMTYKTNKTYTRTYDQMVQAARSGKQNIAEASVDSGTSKKTEMKLLGIARGSLEELLQDFEDFLRQKNLAVWKKEDPRVQTIRSLAYMSYKTYKTYMTYMENAESAANCLICLIHQTNYLLDRLIKSVEKQFLTEGGFTERLYRTRKDYQANKTYETDRTNKTDKTDKSY